MAASVTIAPDTEGLLRELAPQVLGALVRRYGTFDVAEDAVQEALLAAAVQWPDTGVPENPRAWLITVASRRHADRLRAEIARRRRESAVAAFLTPAALVVPAPGDEPPVDADDTLKLLFLCCHPALSPPSQVALTLRAVGGLTTVQIARAFLVPETTMAQRISRAKHAIRVAGARFSMPPEDERPDRLQAVMHVLYLIFNEGYTATSGSDLHHPELADEAIRLCRGLLGVLPEDREITGLLALMLLTDARRPARTLPDGSLVPLAEQDRTRWDVESIREGVALITDALSRGPMGPYQLQAASAAVHDEAVRSEDTDWAQILTLYELLEVVSANPMVTLNHAVAVAMVHGPAEALQLLATLDADERMSSQHRLEAVRAHLLEMVGDRRAALSSYRIAARLTSSLPERNYLEARAAALYSAAAPDSSQPSRSE